MSSLLDALFGTQRQRVLGWLLLHPDDALHVRELARLTQTSAGSLHRELARLAEAGLLTRRRQGNQVLYQADRSCPVFAELAGLFRKTGGLADVLRTALLPLAGQITLALVFGSVARGAETTHSDIDVLVVGEAGFAEVVSALYPCQETLGREINPVVYRAEEWRARLVHDDHFARDILNHATLPLLGKQRNLSDYEGDPVTDSALATCLEEADKLLARTRLWLAAEFPDLAE